MAAATILAIVYTILQFIIFLFVVVATPLPMFRSKAAMQLTSSGLHKQCVTLWGVTTKCNGSKYLSRGTAAFGCGHRRNNMNGGAAFAIISIVFTLVALILGVLLVAKVLPALGALIVTVVCVLTILISWACVAGVMTEKMCKTTISGVVVVPATKYSTSYHYGAGFGLMVTAWCLEVVNLVVVILCLVMKGSDGGSSARENHEPTEQHDKEAEQK